MNRPNKQNYPVGPMDEPIVEFKKYTDDLEKYCDELERELALAKAEPFISVGIATHNKMIKERDERIQVLEKALDRTTDYISNLVPCYRCNLFEQCQYGYKFEQCANTWKQWALSKAEEELKGETE